MVCALMRLCVVDVPLQSSSKAVGVEKVPVGLDPVIVINLCYVLVLQLIQSGLVESTVVQVAKGAVSLYFEEEMERKKLDYEKEDHQVYESNYRHHCYNLHLFFAKR